MLNAPERLDFGVEHRELDGQGESARCGPWT